MRHTHDADGTLLVRRSIQTDTWSRDERAARDAALLRAHEMCGHEAFEILERAGSVCAAAKYVDAAAHAWTAARKLTRSVDRLRALAEDMLTMARWARLAPRVPHYPLRDPDESDAAAERAAVDVVESALVLKAVINGVAISARVVTNWSEKNEALGRRLDGWPGRSGAVGLVAGALRCVSEDERVLLSRLPASAWVKFGVGAGLLPVPADHREYRSLIATVKTTVRRRMSRQRVPLPRRKKDVALLFPLEMPVSTAVAWGDGRTVFFPIPEPNEKLETLRSSKDVRCADRETVVRGS